MLAKERSKLCSHVIVAAADTPAVLPAALPALRRGCSRYVTATSCSGLIWQALLHLCSIYCWRFKKPRLRVGCGCGVLWLSDPPVI